MNRFDYRLAATVLRLLGWLFDRLPLDRRRVVLATARLPRLDGNLAALHTAMRARHPRRRYVLLLEPYSYGLAGKLRYFARLIRGMYYLRTSGLFVVDNAYLPIHVAPHRPGTTVVQVWHAVGALKRFGRDATTPLHEPERRFLHRHYDYVVCTAEGSRAAWAAAFDVPVKRVLPLGSPRTDFFVDPVAMDAARRRVLAEYPELADRRVILYAPTFRGRGKAKQAAAGLDPARLRAASSPNDVLVLKAHPNLAPAATDVAGYDVVIDPQFEINDLLTVTDILITDYSSSIFEYALLRRPLILLVPDLTAYEADPGLYLDYRTEMIGTQVLDTDGVIEAIRTDAFDFGPYDGFIERHLGSSPGRASEQFVERFLGPQPGTERRGGTLPRDVRHQ